MRLLKNVRLRLTLWYTLVLAVLLLAFSILVFILLTSNLNQRLDEGIKLRAEHLSAIIETTDTSEGSVLDNSDILSFQIQQDEAAQVFGPGAIPLLTLGLQLDDSLVKSAITTALKGESGYRTTNTTNGDKIRIFVSPVIRDTAIIGAVLLGRETKGVSATLDLYKNIAFVALILITALAGGGGYFITNRALKPIRYIAETAKDIGDGDLSRRIELTDGDEIGAVVLTLNNMFDRLQSAFIRERRFTSDASHELRTPLSIIEAEATLTLEKTRSKNDYKKSLNLIAQETTHMSSIINDLLFLARSDAGKVKFEMEPLKLGDFIKDLVLDISVLARRKKQKLELKRIENPVILGDEIRLRQLFLNILENAIRYTAAKGTITVSVSIQENTAVVEVIDTGIGIAAGDLGHIFEPFFRADESRARAEGGTGLGLAIGQRIAVAHGGQIKVESQERKGSSFAVSLPVNTASQTDATSTDAKWKRKTSKRFRFLGWPFSK
jgi:heavy metal sensor kinase